MINVDHASLDTEKQQATRPEGYTSSSWTLAIDNRKNEVIKVKFSRTFAQKCRAGLRAWSWFVPRPTLRIPQ